MTITQLRYLVELTESANATQAAQKLNVTRPALTNGIRQLKENIIVSHDADNERFIHQIMAKHGSLHIVLTTPGTILWTMRRSCSVVVASLIGRHTKTRSG